MRIEGLSQNSPEWVIHRIGMVTSSRLADVCAKLKRKDDEAAKRYDYRLEKVEETLTGRAAEHYVSPDMEFGTENQPLAAAAYEMRHNVILEEGGFWVHDRISRFGASPDYLLGDDGVVETKCPRTANHIQTVISDTVPEKYIYQIQGQLACTGRRFCDYVSYDPRIPSDVGLWVKRVERDEKLIAAIEAEVCAFLEDVIKMLQKLGQKVEPMPQDLTEVLQRSVEAVK